MALRTGQRIGVYEITGPLGKGGMGEVYRGRDTKLDREVAVKVLPEGLARDHERLIRFEREAKALAALNHPNIAQIYAVEGRAFIMELVPGETLGERIKRGAVPVDEALNIAAQMASALDAAHEKGIVHRDFKPGNVMVTPDGVVKVLDFGLVGKAPSNNAGEPGQSPEDSPTLTLAATQAGFIMGTAAYMAPEQASGKPVDKRADIWSFGVVLWEMLTGKRLFEGETISHVLAAVLTKEPDLSIVPVRVRPLLQRCLEKDPKKRLRDIGDAMGLVREPGTDPVAAGSLVKQPAPRWFWLTAAMLAIGVAGLGLVAYRHSREAPVEQQALRYTINLPEKALVDELALSPDGRSVVMDISGDNGSQLWIRDLDSLEFRPLAGTGGAHFPFWSPDSRNIAFFRGSSLERMAVAGGPLQTICAAPAGRGGTWNAKGVIVFVPTNLGGLRQVPAGGGNSKPITGDGDESATANQFFLPDGQRFLYTKAGNDAGVYVGSLDGTTPRRVLENAVNAVYWAPTSDASQGYILFGQTGAVMAQPVDAATLSGSGEMFSVISRPADVPGQRALFSIARTILIGTLGGSSTAGMELVWRERSGRKSASIPGPVTDFALSPDEKKIVVERFRPDGSSLWVADLEHKTESRLTFNQNTRAFTPVWSPDGTRIAYTYSGQPKVHVRAADGTGQEQEVFAGKNRNAFSFDWTDDGKYIVVNDGTEVKAAPVAGGGNAIPLNLGSPGSRLQVSPDGRWLAYTSVESGRLEVYVQPFAPSSEKAPVGKWQVSTDGGSAPRWRGDGKELFYQAPDRKIMAVETPMQAASFEHGVPKALFETIMPAASVNSGGFPFTVSRDGQRFLVRELPKQTSQQQTVTVMVNWLDQVRK